MHPTQEEWKNIVNHAGDINEGSTVESEHLALKLDYGVGIQTDKSTGLPIVQSVATVGTGPGTPICLSIVPDQGNRHADQTPNVLYAVGDNQGYITMHHPGGCRAR